MRYRGFSLRQRTCSHCEIPQDVSREKKKKKGKAKKMMMMAFPLSSSVSRPAKLISPVRNLKLCSTQGSWVRTYKARRIQQRRFFSRRKNIYINNNLLALSEPNTNPRQAKNEVDLNNSLTTGSEDMRHLGPNANTTVLSYSCKPTSWYLQEFEHLALLRHADGSEINFSTEFSLVGKYVPLIG